MITDELFSRQHSLKITQELTEYVASGQWEAYANTTKILESISTKDVIEAISKAFEEKEMVIGYFNGNA